MCCVPEAQPSFNFLWVLYSRRSLLFLLINSNMFVSTTSVVLGLYSTCALALNVRYNSGYAHESSNLPSLAERRTHPHVKSRQHDTQDSTCAPYWMEDIKHQGVASFNPNPDNYTVFRNVKSYGAVGDGVTDDTAAIQKAMTEGNRCGPSACESSTNTPAVLYFPGGTYLISSSIIDYYYTQVWSPRLVQLSTATNSSRLSETRTVCLPSSPHPTSPPLAD